jgi:hypothetical protein
MGIRQKFLNRCKELGVEFTEWNDTLSIDAPKGKVFATYFTHHEMIVWQYDGWRKEDVYKRFLEIMSGGVENCDEVGCEICHPELLN